MITALDTWIGMGFEPYVCANIISWLKETDEVTAHITRYSSYNEGSQVIKEKKNTSYFYNKHVSMEKIINNTHWVLEIWFDNSGYKINDYKNKKDAETDMLKLILLGATRGKNSKLPPLPLRLYKWRPRKYLNEILVKHGYSELTFRSQKSSSVPCTKPYAVHPTPR